MCVLLLLLSNCLRGFGGFWGGVVKGDIALLGGFYPRWGFVRGEGGGGVGNK